MALLPLLAVVLSIVQGGSAVAAPRARGFGRLIEDYAPYVGQSRCAPKPKPGVVAFRRIVLAAYPETRDITIGRNCDVGGRSEHKEGRAWDWGVDATRPRERRMANDLLDWLLAEDRYGNRHALARRLGIMYIVWNRRIWSTWERGWEVYCTQRRRGCKSESGSFVNPHTDHVHFSFGWPGARKRTTFWDKRRSMVVGIAGSDSGYWLAGGNGAVVPFDVGFYGSRAGGFGRNVMTGFVPVPSGDGYWLVSEAGKVFAFGAAARHGRVRGAGRVVGIAATPTGQGYWLAAESGEVLAFGDAPVLGGASGAVVVGIAATGTGQGYWLFGEDGEVVPVGDAGFFGDATGEDLPSAIVAGAARGTDGYWLVTRSGTVYPFGTAGDWPRSTAG